MMIVLGAGGHGKVVADILLAGGLQIDGFVDDSKTEPVLGLPILGAFDWLRTHPTRVALGIGDNAARQRMAEECVSFGCELVTAIHPRAVISASAKVEGGAVVMALAAINPDAVIGRGAIVNTGAIIEHDCVLEPFSHVSPNAALGGGCRVGTLAHLGVGASMLPRTSIGSRSVIGGGALVSRDIPQDVTAVGVPARFRMR